MYKRQQQYITSHHDIGFIIGCSYLNGMRMGQEAYDTIIVQAAKSLSTRFRSGAGVIQSWKMCIRDRYGIGGLYINGLMKTLGKLEA